MESAVFLDAYDAKTGSGVAIWTIPGPGEAGNDTWKGDSWKTGSAATWVRARTTPTRILSIGEPATRGPIGNGDVRDGDNCFSIA
jgi:alcohol dehydrogenase (cytochrome c)